MPHNVYRDGRVHVMAEMCDTCIFRPGNAMHLARGVLHALVRDALDADSAIVCHQTLYPGEEHNAGNAVCRGFFDRYATPPLTLARELGVLRTVAPIRRRGSATGSGEDAAACLESSGR